MRINNNLAALNAWRNLSVSGGNLQKSLERLSSGNRINRAADDAAGLAVSEKMNAQIRGINMATRNTQDGISLIQTAEGGASKVQDMLQRMRELAVQSSSGSLENKDRTQLQNEFTELAKEIDRTAKATKFNNTALLDSTVNPQNASTTYAPGAVTNKNGATVAAFGQANTALGAGKYQLTVAGEDTTGDTTADQFVFTLNKWDATAGGGAGAWAATTATVTNSTDTGAINLGGMTFNVGGTFTTAAPAANLPGAATNIAEFDINGTTTGGSSNFTVQVGANSGDTIGFSLTGLTGASLQVTIADGSALDANLSIDDQTKAQAAITKLDTALETVSSARAKMGAYQNRLDNAVSTLQTQSENLTAAASRIKDVDMAAEMAQFTKFQVLQQAGTSMLAQANQLPQGVLKLLG